VCGFVGSLERWIDGWVILFSIQFSSVQETEMEMGPSLFIYIHIRVAFLIGPKGRPF
jgi:hypothetical protein